MAVHSATTTDRNWPNIAVKYWQRMSLPTVTNVYVRYTESAVGTNYLGENFAENSQLLYFVSLLNAES